MQVQSSIYILDIYMQVQSSISQTIQSTFQEGGGAAAEEAQRTPSPPLGTTGLSTSGSANPIAPPPPGRLLSRRMSAAQDLDLAAARVSERHEIDMAVEVGDWAGLGLGLGLGLGFTPGHHS